MANTDTDTRLIAFYLPQFHPIAENDDWWGPGFTEWTNVVQAKPLFPGHYQPHLPRDLGFYDLRLHETRQAQADLARAYGLHGFCYYHYWFHGRRLLERPFEEVLAAGTPDFPFCLCWANEKWTRAWDGDTGHILMDQKHSEEDDRTHIQWLANAFLDPRYIRINDKPLFLVYRAAQLPDPLRTTTLWREEMQQMGVGEICLGRVESFPDEHTDPAELGFDVGVEFQPDWTRLDEGLRKTRLWRLAARLGLSNRVYPQNYIYDYEHLVNVMLEKEEPGYWRFPCVTPSWDNSCRKGAQEATIFHGSTPALYKRWLQAAIARAEQNGREPKVVFINAWNEWGEGNHLEPDLIHGRGYLEATWQALHKA